MQKVLIICTAVILWCIQACNSPQASQQQTKPKADSLPTKVERKITPLDTAQTSEYWQQAALYLGGMPCAMPPFDSLGKLNDAIEHKQYFDHAFSSKKQILLDSLSSWAGTNLGEERNNTEQTVFYPFSGADFVTIHTLYPKAKHYVLFGLEPEGVVPAIEELDPHRRSANLLNVRISSDDIMSLSFFKTIDMAADFRRQELKGTLPLLLAFVSRQGNTVLSVNHIAVNDNGKVELDGDSLVKNPNLQSPNSKNTTGYRIKFKSNDSSKEEHIQTLDYFSVDVLDDKLKKNTGFTTMITELSPAVTYIKSASYLLHKPYFSFIGQKIKEVSQSILQDDSGFPIRLLSDSEWDITYYGVYMTPIPLFANLYQPDLMKAYQNTKAQPLGFGIGYRYQKGTSNLLLAKKKKS